MNELIVRGDVVLHPQNGDEEALVVETTELRGERVMRVNRYHAGKWLQSLWISTRGWTPRRDY